MSIELRPYQKELVEKLSQYRNVGIHDEMGLGKTYAAVALDQVRYEQCDIEKARAKGFNRSLKTLVVAPLSGVVDSWVTHYNTYDPEIRVYRIGEEPKGSITKADREKFIRNVQNDTHDVFVMHWDALRLMPELADEVWMHVIADEYHKAKNRKAQQTKALKAIKKVKFKTGLTGTPMVNHPDELWSLLDWLYVSSREKVGFFGKDLGKILNSYWRFFNTFLEYEVIPPVGYRKITGTKNEPALKAMVDPITIRRTKKEAMPDLPDKYYTDITVELTPSQRKQYDAMKNEMIAWLETQDGQKPLVAPVVIAQLQRLQQFAVATPTMTGTTETREDFGSVWESTSYKVTSLDKPSSKIDALIELVQGTEEQIVVFSQFKTAINLAYDELTKKGISCVRLTGDTKQQDRTRLIKHFQSTTDDPKYTDPELAKSAPQVFLATIRAGGQGIDLFASSTVVFLDRDWSPANNSQAEDRCHRGGQKNAVQIIDIVARNTVDQYRKKKLDLKKQWIRNVLEA